MHIAVLIVIYITWVVELLVYVSISMYVALLCRYLSVDDLLCDRSIFLEPFFLFYVYFGLSQNLQVDDQLDILKEYVVYIEVCIIMTCKNPTVLGLFFQYFIDNVQIFIDQFIVWNVAMLFGFDNMLHRNTYNIISRTADYCILIHIISITSV